MPETKSTDILIVFLFFMETERVQTNFGGKIHF